jgi:hypothetical protein
MGEEETVTDEGFARPGTELAFGQVLWRDLGRPLRDFLGGLADGPRDALARWAAVEAVLVEHGLDTGSALTTEGRRLRVSPSTALADALLRALGEVLGPPLEARGDAFVRWRRGEADVTYTRSSARGDEELAIDWSR